MMSVREREPGDDDDEVTGDFIATGRQDARHKIAAASLTRLAPPREVSAAKNGRPTPLGRAAAPAFPTDLLPEPLRGLSLALSEALQVPADVPALLSLAAVGACVQRRYAVEVWDGYSEPLSLYVAVILDSGERKSAVMQAITQPIAEWERSEGERLNGTIAEELSRRSAQVRRKEHLEAKAAKTDASEDRQSLTLEAAEIARWLAATPEPVLPRVIADDVTPEALGRLLAMQGERMSVFSAEGGIFETMAGRYSNGVPNLDVFLKGHAGDLLRIDRGNGTHVSMDSPALTIGLAVQPDVLHGLGNKPGFRGRGLLARFLYGVPYSLVGYRAVSGPSVPEAVRRKYADRIRALLEGTWTTKQVPITIGLTKEAVAARDALAERLERRMRPGADLSHVKDCTSKASGLAVRLAGLMHLAADRDGGIRGDTMLAAVAIVESYGLPHALAAFAQMGADPEMEAARAVVEWARNRDLRNFSVRDAFNALRGQTRFARVDAIRRACEFATEYGHLKVLPEPRKQPGRPRSPRYLLVDADPVPHPQNPQNAQNWTTCGDTADNADFANEVPPS